MHIPADLKDADELMTRYGRWAMDRWKKQHCGSAEGRYQIPQLEPAPDEAIMPDFRAMDVQRALINVPLDYRKVLQTEYIPQKLHKKHQIRMMRISEGMFRERLLTGLRMLSNIHRTQGRAAT